MILLKIGAVDYSSKVSKKSHSINRFDETESWLDANATRHTTVVRTRIRGKVDLVFSTEAEHQAFISNLASSCVDGYWQIIVYVNNMHSEQTITARVEMDAKPVFGNALVNGAPIVNTVSVTVEEV